MPPSDTNTDRRTETGPESEWATAAEFGDLAVRRHGDGPDAVWLVEPQDGDDDARTDEYGRPRAVTFGPRNVGPDGDPIDDTFHINTSAGLNAGDASGGSSVITGVVDRLPKRRPADRVDDKEAADEARDRGLLAARTAVAPDFDDASFDALKKLRDGGGERTRRSVEIALNVDKPAVVRLRDHLTQASPAGTPIRGPSAGQNGATPTASPQLGRGISVVAASSRLRGDGDGRGEPNGVGDEWVPDRNGSARDEDDKQELSEAENSPTGENGRPGGTAAVGVVGSGTEILLAGSKVRAADTKNGLPPWVVCGGVPRAFGPGASAAEAGALAVAERVDERLQAEKKVPERLAENRPDLFESPGASGGASSGDGNTEDTTERSSESADTEDGGEGVGSGLT